jgi:hypothetical protein
MMRLTVEISAPAREKASGAREEQARLAEFGAALRLVSDRIANTGAPEAAQKFEFGELTGVYSITGAST